MELELRKELIILPTYGRLLEALDDVDVRPTIADRPAFSVDY